ncbi:hypothetical protein RJ640_010815, partial [Escallonia rubra]
MEEETAATDTTFTDKSDICQQLLHRYGKSAAAQHRHLVAAAAAARSILQSESLPLTPLSYFAAAIDAIVDAASTSDSDALAALSSFLAIVLPLIPEGAIAPAKAGDAAAVLVELLDRPSGAASAAANVRAVVKCLGVLLGFCDLEDWDSVKLGFETLLKFSIDKRPKVRKCAQDCILKVFKSFESSTVREKASRLVFSLLKSYMPLAVELSASRSVDGSEKDILSKPEHQEIVHMLNLLKQLVTYFSIEVNVDVFSELQKLISNQFSALARHIFDVIQVLFETLGGDLNLSEADNIIKVLASYVSFEGNPVDSTLSAATLLKSCLNKLHAVEPSKCTSHISLVLGSVAGLLTAEASAASQASDILKELIDRHVERGSLAISQNQQVDDEAVHSMEASAVKSTCSVLMNVLGKFDGIPNKHILAVISALFLKLGSVITKKTSSSLASGKGSNSGEVSFFYMKDIVLRLADLISVLPLDTSDAKDIHLLMEIELLQLQECMGSSIISTGPEKLLMLLPISFNDEDLTCTNIWLVPILRIYVLRSSLGFFMEHVVPLTESLQRACRKVKKSVIRQDLQARAQECWGLLPAFCRHPTDTYKNFGRLAKLLIPYLKKDSFMLEIIAISLQELVNQNRSVLRSGEGADNSVKVSMMADVSDLALKVEDKPSYSEKVASKNIRALASYSKELLQALIDVLFIAPREKRSYLKDAIKCLVSITDSSVTKKIFVSSLERFQLINDMGECGEPGISVSASVEKKSNSTSNGKEANRCLILELAASIVEGASEDLIDLLFNFIRHTLQETDEIGQCEAYLALNKILEEHPRFCSSKYDELMELLLGLKSPEDISSLRSRFACFQTLLVHAIKSLDQEDTKAFLILNEIILALKDSKEEGRKAAYDILIEIGSSLRNSLDATSGGPYHKLISMITGYLSGSSPHIKSGAVSALSVLVHSNTDICCSMPDLVPSVLELLQSKATEVIKAVLGFVKVLVLSLQANDLRDFLPNIINRILPWSSISRNHFRSKVTVILEIMMRKCGSAAVKLLAPDKYRNFVKSVLENRHGKTDSKEPGSTEIEPPISDTSTNRSDFHTLL